MSRRTDINFADRRLESTNEIVREEVQFYWSAAERKARTNEGEIIARPSKKVPSGINNIEKEDERAEGGLSVLQVAHAFQTSIVGRRSINTLQEWEGYVSEIDGVSFSAILHDITDKNRGDEVAKIPMKLLDRDERPHLKIGAIFRLVIGLAKTSHGNRINESIIYFRRYQPRVINKGKEIADMIRSSS